MKKKKYEVRGMMEWHPEFKVGKTRIKVSFTGGHLCGGASTPAVFETSDPVVQTVIEKSAAFRSRKIRVGSIIESKDPEIPPEPSPSESAPVKEFVLEYDDIEEVYDFLQHQKGVPLDRLCTTDSCQTEAKRLGIILKKK